MALWLQSGDLEIDTAGWSGEGTFTSTLVEGLKGLKSIVFLRVENAPSSRTDADYMFISNEIYVKFHDVAEKVPSRVLGIFPVQRVVMKPSMSLVDLEAQLTGMMEIGPADYADDTMLQYLKTERIVPPYQTRGYKLVEMVRVYAISAATARARPA